MSEAASVIRAPERDTKGIFQVFSADILWSTVGLGIRLIKDAVVWQILLYRSIALSVFLYIVIGLRKRGCHPTCRGLTSKEIGSQLGLSYRIIEVYQARFLKKFKARILAEFVAKLSAMPLLH